MEIRVLPAIRIPYIGPDVHMEATQVLAELPSGPVDACDCELLRADVSTVSLTGFVWSGELRGFDEPVIAPHRITRIFGSPVTLLVDGIMRLQITSVSATVGEHELATEEITVGDRRQLAWMVANVLDHTRVWFANTDRTTSPTTNSQAVHMQPTSCLDAPQSST